MAWVGPILGVVSAATGLGGMFADKQAQQFASAATADLAGANLQQIGNQSAQRELQVRAQGEQVLGAQAAAIAESGVGFGGSSRKVQEQDALGVEMDALNTRYEGLLKIAELDAERAYAMAEKPSWEPISWQIGKKIGAVNIHTNSSDWGKSTGNWGEG